MSDLYSVSFVIPANRVIKENIYLLFEQVQKRKQARYDSVKDILQKFPDLDKKTRDSLVLSEDQLQRMEDRFQRGENFDLPEDTFWYVNEEICSDIDSYDRPYEKVQIRLNEASFTKLPQMDYYQFSLGSTSSHYAPSFFYDSPSFFDDYLSDLQLIIDIFDPVLGSGNFESEFMSLPPEGRNKGEFQTSTSMRFYPAKFVEKKGLQVFEKMISDQLPTISKEDMTTIMYHDNISGFFLRTKKGLLFDSIQGFKEEIDGKPYWQYQYELNKELFDMIKNGDLRGGLYGS